MKNFVGWIIRSYRLFLALGVVLTAIASVYACELYKNLRPDFEELLPTSTRSVKDFQEVSERLKSVESLVVLVQSKDKATSRRFVKDLHANLSRVPKDTISYVAYRADEEMAFFKGRAGLMIDQEDLLNIKKFVSNEISYAKRSVLSLFGDEEKKEEESPVDIRAMEEKYLRRGLDVHRFPDGYYATQDEKTYAVVVYMPGKGLDQARKMKAAIERGVAEVNPQSYGNELAVQYTGNIENLLEESAALVADLEFSTIVVLLLVCASLYIFYGSVRASFALTVSLIMGTLWTFGLAYFVVKYLNANSAFLGSIILGNGINFGIIYLARYLEERRQGRTNYDALCIASTQTAGATLIAATACSLAYGSLMLTQFRGFSQFGVIGFMGMILCWIAEYTILPAMLTVVDKYSKPDWFMVKRRYSPFSRHFTRWVDAHSRAICAITAVFFVVSTGALVVNRNNELLETDLSNLKDKRSVSQGSGALYHYIDDIFGHSLSPLVILAKTPEQTREIASKLREARDSDPETQITTVQTLADFVPNDQKEKIGILRDIRKLLTPTVVKHLKGEQKQFVTEFINSEEPKPFTQADLPAPILERFRENDNSVGKIVLLDKSVDVTGRDDTYAIRSFVKTARNISDTVGPGILVAGQLPILSDMIDSIILDGPKATFFAFLGVLLLLIILFRSRTTVGLAMFTLLLGVYWFAAMIVGFNLKINFLNFIALPITFGIGVDYGINIFQRYRKEGPESILHVMQTTGGAVLLCSITTVIGYGSLLLAGNQAFVSFGTLAILGEVACTWAALVALPAYISLRNRSRNRPEGTARATAEQPSSDGPMTTDVAARVRS
jgi:uncharacterized protein